MPRYACSPFRHDFNDILCLPRLLLYFKLINSSCPCSIEYKNKNQFIDSNHYNVFISARKKAGETGKKQSVELPLKRRNESPVWVQANIEAGRDDASEVTQWRVVLMDITPKMAAEAALIESEERFRGLFEHAPVAYQSLDERGNFIAVNETWLATLDYSEIDVIGKNFSDFLHPDWNARFEENFTRLKTVGEVLGNEFVMKKKDGTDILVSFHGKISQNVMGGFKQIHCVFYDISAQRKAEKENKRLENKLQQALLNLFVNAWQAMPGGGNLYIQTENATLDEKYIKPFEIVLGKYVKISVTDTGIGMDRATRERIFDPFFSTKGMTTSSGLGLASVYGIIKNHGGFINVSSEMGKGTTFEIYLPASDQELVEETSGPDRHGIQYGQETVLLVDDEAIIIDVGQKMLERLGYRVLIARSGDEALEVYGKQGKEIALVILDMIMPGMGGGETYDRMKAIDGGVRVLLSSGYSIEGQAKEIMDRGCKGFIQKPFSLYGLSMKIREALCE